MTHGEAVAAIESVVATFASYGHEENGNFWWTVTEDGNAASGHRVVLRTDLVRVSESEPFPGIFGALPRSG
jgi:hypothetical protein